ncbi:MAG: RsmF rRNA methyltransferase first C-terminal domain-containing protein [Cyclobacterium sp.]|uniref:methyltransferase RsmF C-terminal domain-like protein n=1 Tax=Cyclobacterium sp. TaxID=1966343 RepID=UPI00397071BF
MEHSTESQIKNRLPETFLDQMKQQLGQLELEQFLQALEQKTPVSLRLNPKKCQTSPFEGSPLPWCPQAYYLEERPIFTLDPLFHLGAYYVQEASSNFLWQALHQLDLPHSPLALDLCAAPGGKSTLISSFLGEEGLLVANEVIKSRNQVLRENLIKWGLGNAIVSQNDPSHFSNLENSFDFVLVDAPCSGEGLFRKDPQAIAEWSQENVHVCKGRQLRILQQAAGLPKPGGYLIYSTCTYNWQENEENVRYLVENFGYEKVIVPIKNSWHITQSEITVSSQTIPCYRFYPHKVKGEGLFMAILRKPASGEPHKPLREGRDFNHPHLKRFSIKNSKRSKFPELNFPFEVKLYQYDKHVFALPEKWSPVFEKVATQLNVQYFGVELGDWTKEQFFPAHAWAMGIYPISDYPSVALSREEAIQYLKKEPITLSIKERGWVLVKYKGLNLGWIKNLGNRSNNYYPKEWRIRMK